MIKSDSGICYKDVACHACQVNINYCYYNLKHNGFVISYNDMSPRDIYNSRKNNNLDEWNDFCDWIKKLPYSTLMIECDD